MTVTVPPEMRLIRAVFRSDTSAEPSGRNASPHGTASPVAIVLATRGVGGTAATAGVAEPAVRTAASARLARMQGLLSMSPSSPIGHNGTTHSGEIT
jgi:hypothetical protein